MSRLVALVLAAALMPAAARAFDPVFAGPAEPSAAAAPVPGSYLLPTGPFRDGAVPGKTLEGRVQRRAWRIEDPEGSTLELVSALRTQLSEAGFRILFDCETRACGGFDFRFGLDILPEPDMHVDLGDFRFLSAERGPGEALGLLVSRSTRTGFVQITTVEPAAFPATPPGPVPAPLSPPPPDLPAAQADEPQAPPSSAAQTEIGAALVAAGHAVLGDLDFAPGSAELAGGSFPSLVALAAWLEANPQGSVALVGHTDASGGLSANIDLSRRRAEAVRRYLIDVLGADGARLEAQGVGYLAPLGSNATDEGRAVNRRVEAVLTSGP